MRIWLVPKRPDDQELLAFLKAYAVTVSMAETLHRPEAVLMARTGDAMNDIARVTEIAQDHYLISVYVPEFNLRFNHFLIKDEEPLLFHTGMKQMFPLVRDAVARVLDPATIRWISFSHYEADECGALNEWLQVAPNATALCGLVGALVSVNDMAIRPARVMAHDEVLQIGRSRVRFRQTPHVPHNWEAGLLFEEVSRPCSARTCSRMREIPNRSPNPISSNAQNNR